MILDPVKLTVLTITADVKFSLSMMTGWDNDLSRKREYLKRRLLWGIVSSTFEEGHLYRIGGLLWGFRA